MTHNGTIYTYNKKINGFYTGWADGGFTIHQWQPLEDARILILVQM